MVAIEHKPASSLQPSERFNGYASCECRPIYRRNGRAVGRRSYVDAGQLVISSSAELFVHGFEKLQHLLPSATIAKTVA